MDFQTPEWVCELMVSLIPDGVMTVLEPTPGKGNLVRALSQYHVTAPLDFYQLPSGHWDAVVMNPPFSPMRLGYQILYACMDMSDIIIALMPWLTIINSQRRAMDIEAFGLADVFHLPRSCFPGARVQTCVMKLIRYHSEPTRFHLTSHWS